MSTIKIGIDLGTTNSSISVIHDNEPIIIKNSFGQENTPSVVFADKNGNFVVGSRAKKNLSSLDSNFHNTRSEIKRLMGTSETVAFPHLNKIFLPEEVSSEILKALRGDVQRKFQDIVLEAAVITVPAYFSTIQSEATKRAGSLAGFEQVVLLQEPIAAAIAYGFLHQKNENWLVYDLGGGTFDVALVSLNDGSLTVLAHAGDNFLGGKDFDAAMIQHLILPSLASSNIELDAAVHQQIFHSLKELVETAKIELSVHDQTTIDIDIQTKDLNIQHSLTVSREDFLQSCKYLLEKTADLCEKVMNEAKVDISTVRKIVLVGGPTQMPILQEFLKSRLSLPVDGSLDPFTVVAKGAAMYGNQIAVEQKKKSDTLKPACQLEVNFIPVTSDDEQTITGKVLYSGESIKPYSIQFVSSDDSFSSEEILIRNCKFILKLPTGIKGTQYWIYVKDYEGQLISSTPESIYINRGISIIGSPLPYSIGVSVSSLSSQRGYKDFTETIEFFFSKNSILPLKSKKRFYTLFDLKAGSSANVLPICIYEGESLMTSRNTLICHLTITGESLAKHLKKGAPVDITIQVNESRELSVTAYLPDMDMTLNARGTIYFDASKIDDVKKNFTEQVSRSESVMASLESTNEINIIESIIRDIKFSIDNSASDSDQQRKAEKQVKDLMIALDQIEAKTHFNSNIEAFWNECQKIEKYFENCNPPEKKMEYEEVYGELREDGIASISKKDSVLIGHIVQKLEQLYFKCLYNDPIVLREWIQDIINKTQEISDTNSSFKDLVIRAQEAMTELDIREMKESLRALFPFTSEAEIPQIKLKSGITL
ncbi:MAG: Hsp70 family protein [Alphaproteobacteria bacterium]|nr:Hsp70 family protein [Alphaproteobacteria bacterium]